MGNDEGAPIRPSLLNRALRAAIGGQVYLPIADATWVPLATDLYAHPDPLFREQVHGGCDTKVGDVHRGMRRRTYVMVAIAAMVAVVGYAALFAQITLIHPATVPLLAAMLIIGARNSYVHMWGLPLWKRRYAAILAGESRCTVCLEKAGACVHQTGATAGSV
jgi:hypothetical protein